MPWLANNHREVVLVCLDSNTPREEQNFTCNTFHGSLLVAHTNGLNSLHTTVTLSTLVHP